MGLSTNRYDIKLIVYYFDGVMTDNKEYLKQNCNECSGQPGWWFGSFRNQKTVHWADHNIYWKKPPLFLHEQKNWICSVVIGWITKHRNQQIPLSEVAYVGNYINDLEVMKLVGKTFSTADAHSSIKQISQYILETKGGEGV